MKSQTLDKERVTAGSIFRHYKGKLYKILAVARHSEDTSLYVVYQGLYNCPEFGPSPTWIRPYHEFVEEVMIDGKNTPRFMLIRLEN